LEADLLFINEEIDDEVSEELKFKAKKMFIKKTQGSMSVLFITIDHLAIVFSLLFFLLYIFYSYRMNFKRFFRIFSSKNKCKMNLEYLGGTVKNDF
jgi:hypothetical protein